MSNQLLQILDNSLLQGLTYGIAVLGVTLSIRVLRYPDLTGDGSFLLGAATFASCLLGGWNWILAAFAAALAGAIAGAVTAVAHFALRVSRLLTGILVSMACYSISFRVLGNRSNVSIGQRTTIFTAAERFDASLRDTMTFLHPASVLVCIILALVLGAAVSLVLRSSVGLLVRAFGANQELASSFGWSGPALTVLGLCAGNALVGLAGCLVVSRQGFADLGMGSGTVILLIAALVFGEELSRFAGLDPGRGTVRRVFISFLGSVLYFFFFLTVLRLSILGLLPFSIQPTDLRFLSAAVLAGVIGLRYFLRPQTVKEEVFPL